MILLISFSCFFSSSPHNLILTQHNQRRDALFVARRVSGIFTDVSALIGHLHIADLNGWVFQSGRIWYKSNTSCYRGCWVIYPKVWMKNCNVGSLCVSPFIDPWHLHYKENKFKINSDDDQLILPAQQNISESSCNDPSEQVLSTNSFSLDWQEQFISDLSELGLAWVWKLASQCHCLTRIWHDFWLHPHTLSQRSWKKNEKRPWEQETTFTNVWINSGDPRPPHWTCQREIQRKLVQSRSSGVAK